MSAKGAVVSGIEVAVRYHRDEDGWWADSAQVAGWTAVGESLDEVRALAKEGLPFYLEVDPSELALSEEREDGLPVVSLRMSSLPRVGRGTLTERPSSAAGAVPRLRPKVTEGVVRCR